MWKMPTLTPNAKRRFGLKVDWNVAKTRAKC
jgi:hypothetical protein